jgi:hypothetical protein
VNAYTLAALPPVLLLIARPQLWPWALAVAAFVALAALGAAAQHFRNERDEARGELARREREEAPPPIIVESESDPAEYGVGDGPDSPGPDEVTCLVCGYLAIEHTRGRYSFYGVCPSPRMVDLVRAAEEARPDLRIVGPTPPVADEAWLDEITKPDGWVG